MGIFERTNGKMDFILKKISYLKWRISQNMIDGFYYDDLNAQTIMEFDSDNIRIYNKFFFFQFFPYLSRNTIGLSLLYKVSRQKFRLKNLGRLLKI